MSDLDGLIDHATRRFAERSGHAPTWAAAAPGRVNLIGEHTDYNQGFVLPMATDRWCVCVAGPATGGTSWLCARDIDHAIELSLGDALARGDALAAELPAWARYLVGAIVEHARGLGLTTVPELDLLALSTVPVGAGLSSSAAIETAAAVLLEQAVGREPPPPHTESGPGAGLPPAHAPRSLLPAPGDPYRLARAIDCQRAEHRWAGVPCGLMDQLASSLGVADHALLIDCRDNAVTPVPLPHPNHAVLLVVNSGVHHELAAGEYAARRAACDSASAALGIGSLRELPSLDAVDWPTLDDEQARCVRHVVGENARVLEAVAALHAGGLSEVGRLMHRSHDSLSRDYRVSCRELDLIVETAGAVPGVFGARMTGAGFGGCAVALATPGAAEQLATTLPPAYHARTGNTCTVEHVRAVAGAASTHPSRR